ncbi:MAG: hypothetical protein EBR30_05760 [Cytophagia bacterium]|nr:hypothetical protein [Cytophagia bacterium]
MKRLFYFLCIVSVFSLTSCITIIEEIFLNKDGSGKFLLTVDLSAVMGMKEMLAGKLNSANSDSLSLLQEKFDSIIYFNDMKDSVRRTLSYYGEAKEVKEEDRLAESMSKMMFATARVKSIYHLPGKIKSTTIPGATVKGNQCEVELSYPDFINRKKTMDGIITYK